MTFRGEGDSGQNYTMALKTVNGGSYEDVLEVLSAMSFVEREEMVEKE